MKLIAGLNGVKAKRDGANQVPQHDVLPVLPTQLVKLRHNTFLREVLEPYCEHVSKVWLEDKVDQIKVEHRYLHKFYSKGAITRVTINKHDK